MKKQLLANLKAIDPDTALFGVCSCAVVGMSFGDETMAYRWLWAAFRDWPEFSGSPAYPVPHAKLHQVHAYNWLKRWSKHTPYGRARRRLLKFLIRRLEDELR